MHSTNGDKSERDRRLDEVATAYVKEIESGRAPNQAEWLARYPDLANELAGFFTAIEHVDQLAAPLRMAAGSDAPTLAPGPSMSSSSSIGMVRYFGDYELLQEIARGGMGVVYKAKQVSLNRQVALKMILAGQLASAADVQRFRTEAEAAANLDHPNIVPIYEVGEHEGQHFFSMKLVEGDSLGQWIADSKLQISNCPSAHQSNAARLISMIARAVHHAHQRGTLHRDLKPANVLLEGLNPKSGISNLKSATPMVTDFGLAKRLEGDKGVTQSGAIVGTPSYMAPEQAAGKKGLSIRADVYSLGAILYELLTGQPPFKADTPLDTLLQVLEREPARPRQMNARINSDLETICLKCLEKEPQRRYPTAEALAEDLDCWLRGEPIQARRAGRVERVWRWARRNPERVMFGSIAATLVVLIGLAAFLGYRTTTAAQEQSIQHLYSAHMNLGQQALDAGKHSRLMDLLQPYMPWPGQPDRRGWEWHFLRAHCPIDLDVHVGSQVRDTTAWSPNGRWLAWGAEDGTTKVWEVSTGKQVFSAERMIYRHSGVRSLAWSPDCQRLASSMVGDKDVKVWDIAMTQQPLNLSGHEDEVLAVSWTPDGQLASLAMDYSVILWNLGEGTHVTMKTNSPQLSPYTFVTMHWRPNASELVTSTQLVGGEMKFWDLKTLKVTRTLPTSAHSWSPDGRFFVNAAGIFNVTTGKLERPLKIPANLHPERRIIWSPNGRKLAVADGGMSIKIRDAESLQETHAFHGRIEPLAWSPDSKRFAVGGTIWDLAHQEQQVVLGTRNAVNPSNYVGCVAWSPNGKQLAWGTAGGTMEVWDKPSKRMLHTASGIFHKLAWSPDGKYLASIDGGGSRRVTIWDSQSWQIVTTLPGLDGTWAFKLQWSGDGRWLAAGHGNKINLWEVQGWREQPLPKELGNAFQGQDSFGGWKDDTELIIRQPGGFYTWDPARGKPARLLYQDFRAPQFAAPTRDGERTAYPSNSAGEITIYEWPTRTVLPLRGHTDLAREVVWNPDFRRLASIAADETLKIWDSVSGQELLSFRAQPGTGGFHSLAFSPNGRSLAAGRGDHSVILWDAPRDRLTLPDPELVRRFPWVPPDERDASQTWRIFSYCTLAATGILVIPWGLLRWALRSLGRGRSLYLAIAGILGLALAAYFYFTDTSHMGVFGIDNLPGSWKLNAEGRWAYTTDARIEFVPLMGLPFVALVLILVASVVQRRWWRLASVVAIWPIATISPVCFVLLVNPRLMNPLQHYSWDGWYFTLLIGAWSTGLLVSINWLIGMAIRALPARSGSFSPSR